MNTKYAFTHTSFALLLACSVIVEAFTLLFIWDLSRPFSFPELAYLVLPYQIVTIVLFSMAQIALFSAWRLAFAAQKEAFYEKSSEKWITLFLCAMYAILLITCGVSMHLLCVEGIANLSVTVFLVTLLILETALIGVTHFAKCLYIGARTEHEELQEVI